MYKKFTNLTANSFDWTTLQDSQDFKYQLMVFALIIIRKTLYPDSYGLTRRKVKRLGKPNQQLYKLNCEFHIILFHHFQNSDSTYFNPIIIINHPYS